MLRLSALLAILRAFQSLPFAIADAKLAIWLPSSEDTAFTLTVGHEDWSFPETDARDYEVDQRDGKAVVGYLDFLEGGPRTIPFWIRRGNKDSPKRGMTRCSATYSDEDVENGIETNLLLALDGGLSMWEGEILKPDWLVCDKDTWKLFAKPDAGQGDGNE